MFPVKSNANKKINVRILGNIEKNCEQNRELTFDFVKEEDLRAAARHTVENLIKDHPLTPESYNTLVILLAGHTIVEAYGNRAAGDQMCLLLKQLMGYTETQVVLSRLERELKKALRLAYKALARTEFSQIAAALKAAAAFVFEEYGENFDFDAWQNSPMVPPHLRAKLRASMQSDATCFAPLSQA